MDIQSRHKHDHFNTFNLIGIPLSIIILLGSVLFWLKLKETEKNNVNQQLQTAIHLATAPLKAHISDTIKSLDRMGKRWIEDGGTSEAKWYADANNYYKDNPSLEALAYTDASLEIKRIVPAQYKDFLGFKISSVPNRKKLFETARLTKQITLSKLFNLIQGPKGFIIVDPIYTGDQFNGYLSMSITVNKLMENFFEDGFGENFNVSIYQDGSLIYSTGSPVANSFYVTKEKINFYNVTWYMYISPTPVFLKKMTSHMPDYILGSGIIMSLLFLVGFYFFSESRQSKHYSEHLAFKLQKILDTVNEGFITTDDKLNVIYMNDFAIKMLGWTMAEAEGKNIQNIVVPERYRQEHKSAMQKYFDIGDESMMNKEIEFIAVNKSGREFPVEIILFPVIDDGNTTFHSFIRDISARKKAELDQARYVSIIAASDDAIISADLNGKIKTWNPAAERLLGYSCEEAVGQSISIVYENPELLPALLEKLKEGQSINLETHRRHKDGHLILVSVLVSPIKNALGKVVGGASITRDITERKKIDKMKDEFISVVSHELRTPLTSIRGSLGLLENGKLCEVNQKAQQLLNIATSNCERLIRLINDILDIEKITAGKMHFKTERVNLYSLLNATLESMQGMASRNNINLTLTGDEHIEVMGDHDRLTQVVTNLLSNAIAYSPTKGTVDVTLQKNNDAVKVSIIDYGQGIPVNFRDKIFSKFSQADSSDTRKMGGTGLGLSISKAIIEKHHGTIGFDTIEGKGTTFYFNLPISN